MRHQVGFHWEKICAVIILCATGGLYSLQSQVANNDYYTAPEGVALSVPAPGVLANDTGGPLRAILVSRPANGTLTFNTNGAFVYTPTNSFSGVDGFTYQASNGSQTSSVASVIIMVQAPGELFYDNFSRPTNGGPIFPWVVEAAASSPAVTPNPTGSWSIAGNSLVGISTSGYTYTAAYFDANWTNFSVQAQMQVSSINGVGCGLGGRFNPATGARYIAWMYPENSPDGPTNSSGLPVGWHPWPFSNITIGIPLPNSVPFSCRPWARACTR